MRRVWDYLTRLRNQSTESILLEKEDMGKTFLLIGKKLGPINSAFCIAIIAESGFIVKLADMKWWQGFWKSK